MQTVDQLPRQPITISPKLAPSSPSYVTLSFAGILLISLIAFYWQFLTGESDFYRGDTSRFFEPLCTYIGTALKQGRIPLWNSLEHCGMSQVAIVSPGIFYPPNIAFAVLPFSQALGWLQVFHQWLCGFGIFLLIRRTWGVYPAVAAGLTLSLCGYNFSAVTNYTLVATMAWLPMCLFGLTRIPRSGRPASMVIGTSFLYAMMLLGGRPEIWIPGSILCVGVVLWQFYSDRSMNHCSAPFPVQRKIPSIMLQLSAMALGVMLCMPAILPAAEWALSSPRANGLAVTDALTWSANWYDFLCLFLAAPLGDTGTAACRFLSFGSEAHCCINYITSVFVGPIVLTLAIWGTLDKSWHPRQRIAILLTLAVFTIACLGEHAPLTRSAISHISLLRIFRYPIKLFVFVDALLAVLAARGLKHALSSHFDSAQIKATIISWCAIGSLTMLVPWIAYCFQWGGHCPHELYMDAQQLISRSFLNSFLVALGVCLARYLFSRDLINKTCFCLGISLSVLVSLMQTAATTELHALKSNSLSQKQELVSAIDHAKIGRDFGRLFFPDANLWGPSKAYQSEHSQNIEKDYWQYQRDILKPSYNIDAGIPSAFGFEGSLTNNWQDFVYSAISADALLRNSNTHESGDSADAPLYQLCRLSATGLVATRKSNMSDYGRNIGSYITLSPKYFLPIDSDANLNIKLYRVRNPLPRAYFPDTWSYRSSFAEIKNAFLDPTGTLDPAKCCLLLGAPHNSPILDGSHQPRVGNARFCNGYPDEHIVLVARTDALRPLVLADTFYPGWEAFIDKKQVPIACANGFCRAVFVPAGMHTIEFIYRPKSLMIGLLIAEFAAAIIAIAMLSTIAGKCLKRFRA